MWLEPFGGLEEKKKENRQCSCLDANAVIQHNGLEECLYYKDVEKHDWRWSNVPTVKEDMDVFYIAGHAHLCLPPTAFPRLVTVLSSRLFFSGAWSCYRQDKAGLPELGLSIIPLPSSEKKKKKNSAGAHQHTAEEERRKWWRKWERRQEWGMQKR